MKQQSPETSDSKATAGICHDINNPLTFVLVNVAYCKEAMARLKTSGGSIDAVALCAELSELETILAEAEDGAKRVRTLVQDLGRLSLAAPSVFC